MEQIKYTAEMREMADKHHVQVEVLFPRFKVRKKNYIVDTVRITDRDILPYHNSIAIEADQQIRHVAIDFQGVAEEQRANVVESVIINLVAGLNTSLVESNKTKGFFTTWEEEGTIKIVYLTRAELSYYGRLYTTLGGDSVQVVTDMIKSNSQIAGAVVALLLFAFVIVFFIFAYKTFKDKFLAGGALFEITSNYWPNRFAAKFREFSKMA